MANEKRLIDANALRRKMQNTDRYFYIKYDIDEAPTVDAVEVVQIEKVKIKILQTLDVLIANHRDISNSQFSDYEKCLGIPKSSNNYYGIYADTMEIARRLVNAALTDLCKNCGAEGERKDNECCD